MDAQPGELEGDTAAGHHGHRRGNPAGEHQFPAFNPSPSAASWLASHATDAAGCPMTAALAAVITTSPSIRTTQPDQSQVVQLSGPTGDGTVEATRAGVVGNHVGQGELEALVTRIEHVNRTEDDVSSGQHGKRRRRRLDVARE